MAVQIVYETHSASQDNEQGIATGGSADASLARAANRHGGSVTDDATTASTWSSPLT